jgi:hypothetical protein
MIYPEQVLKGIKYMKNRGYSKVVSSVWGAVWENGEVLECEHTHCFGASKQSEYTGAKWIVSRIQDNGAAGTYKFEEDLVKFYDWLFNESPWADVFITKNGKQAVEERWLVVHTDVPSNQMVGALMASRIPSESSNPMFVMNDLEEFGVPRTMGFLIGQCLAGGDKREGSAKWGDTTAEHRCISAGQMTRSVALNFLEGQLVEPNEHYVDNTRYAYPNLVNDLWGHGEGISLPKFIECNFDAKAILSDVEEVVCLNPFKRVEAVAANTVSYTDAIKAMGKFYPRIEKEFLDGTT